MSCALTQGYNINCRNTIGGVKEVFVIEYDDVLSITETDGIISEIFIAEGKGFYYYQLAKSTSNAVETLTGSTENGTVYYNQSIEVVLNKMQAAFRNELIKLSQNRLMFLVVTRDGTIFLYGRTLGIDLNSSVGSTGVNAGDRNGYALSFTGSEPEPAPIISDFDIIVISTGGDFNGDFGGDFDI